MVQISDARMEILVVGLDLWLRDCRRPARPLPVILRECGSQAPAATPAPAIFIDLD